MFRSRSTLSAILLSVLTFSLVIGIPTSESATSIAPKVLQKSKTFYIQPSTQIKSAIYSYSLWDSRGKQLLATGKIRAGVTAKLTLKSSTTVNEIRVSQYATGGKKILKQARYLYRNLTKIILVAVPGSTPNSGSASPTTASSPSSTKGTSASPTPSSKASSSSSPTASPKTSSSSVPSGAGGGGGGGGVPSTPTPTASGTRSASPTPTIKTAPTPSPTPVVNVPTAQPAPASSPSPAVTSTPPPTIVTAPPTYSPAPIPSTPGIPQGATAQCMNGWFVFSSQPDIACRAHGGVQIYY